MICGPSAYCLSYGAQQVSDHLWDLLMLDEVFYYGISDSRYLTILENLQAGHLVDCKDLNNTQTSQHNTEYIHMVCDMFIQ